MLTLTENASTVVKTIATQQLGAAEGGLRISSQDGDGSFAISAVPEGQPGDQLVENDGAKVFVDEGASPALTDKVLDAQIDDQGNVQFRLGQQA